MKSRKLIYPLFILLFLTFTGTSSAREFLVIATDDWPPYEYKEDGRIVGFSTEVVKAVLKNMGVSIASLTIYPWARAEKLAFNGKVDMIYCASKSDKRLEHCYFPDEPLIISPNLMFIRKADAGKLKFDAFHDLKGHRVGVVREYAYTKEFLDYLKNEGIRTVTALDDEENFKMLMNTIVDYIPADLGNSYGIIRKLKLKGKVVAFRENPIKTAGLYALFSKRRVDKKFVKKFSKYLTEFKKTKRYKAIYNRYFDLDLYGFMN